MTDNPIDQEPIEPGIPPVEFVDPAQQVETPSVWQEASRHSWRKKVGIGAALAAAVATTYLGVQATHKLDGHDFKAVDITEIGRDTIDAIEVIGPTMVTLAALHIASLGLNKSRRTNLKLGYEGFVNRKGGLTRKLVTGALLPAAGIVALTNAVAIEDGIRQGPNRSVTSLFSDVAQTFPDREIVWVTQPGTDHFMNQSNISPTTVLQVETAVEAGREGVAGLEPIRINLVTVPTPHNGNQAGMVITSNSQEGSAILSPKLQDGANCEVDENDRCELGPNDIIVDANEGFNVGDTITIRGHEFSVIGLSQENQSLLNRLVVYTGATPGPEGDYYGLVTVADSKEAVDSLIQDLGLTDELETQSIKELLEQNSDFWAKNGTPLMLLLIGNLAAFATVSFFGAASSDQERAKKVTAGIRANAMTRRGMLEAELARSTILTAKGVVPGVIAASAAQALINSMLTGFHGEATPLMMASATGMILVFQASANVRSYFSQNRQTLVERIREN